MKKFSIFSILLSLVMVCPVLVPLNFNLTNYNSKYLFPKMKEPVEISDSGWNTGWSSNPSMAIDNNGTIHVVWQDSTSGPWSGPSFDEEIMYANYTSSGWSKAIVISDINGWNNGDSWYPSIATDINGNLHVVWQDDTDGEWGDDWEIMYVNYTSSGWSNVTVISDIYGWNDGSSGGASIATDKNGNIHVVWEDSTDGEWGYDNEIMYTNYTASGWSNATVISDLYGWNNGSSSWPSIITDIDGNVHVVWHDHTNGEWGTDPEIMYVNYTVSGWSNATVISDDFTGWNNDYSWQSSIASDKDGNIHVVWEDYTNGTWGNDSEIMYVNYTVSGWSNATVISDLFGWNDGDSSLPNIATDADGNLHIVWQDKTNGEWSAGIQDWEIMYSNYTALMGWSNATVISDDISGWNDGISKGPCIAINKSGTVHAVWEDYTDGAWGTDSEIMYANFSGFFWSKAIVISDIYPDVIDPALLFTITIIVLNIVESDTFPFISFAICYWFILGLIIFMKEMITIYRKKENFGQKNLNILSFYPRSLGENSSSKAFRRKIV